MKLYKMKGMLMKRSVLTIIAIVCAVAFFTPKADAAMITIEIEAVVSYVEDTGNYLEGKIGLGSIITGYYTYESTTQDSSPADPVQGNYWHYSPPAGIYLSVGGFNFQTDPTNVEFQVFIRNNNQSGDDVYGVGSSNNLALVNGTIVNTIYWQLNDHTASALLSDALPTTPPVLTKWQSNHLRLEGQGLNFLVDAQVTTAIPEPSTFLLFGLGTLLLRKRYN
jgi:hypothetical protein